MSSSVQNVPYTMGWTLAIPGMSWDRKLFSFAALILLPKGIGGVFVDYIRDIHKKEYSEFV